MRGLLTTDHSWTLLRQGAIAVAEGPLTITELTGGHWLLLLNAVSGVAKWSIVNDEWSMAFLLHSARMLLGMNHGCEKHTSTSVQT
jgi:hypothetical protein